MMFFWAQAIGFQALWFNGILGMNQWLPAGIILLIASVAFSPKRAQDLRLWPIALIGFLGDLLLTQVDFFSFEQPPIWLATIWLGFAFTLNHSMNWLFSIKLPLQAMVGGIAGAMSYLAGARLGAVELPLGTLLSAAILSSYWAILLPTIVLLSKRLTMEKQPI